MGQPQKILDIARRMITLSGHSVKNKETEEGDIAIEIKELRPDEELLIDNDSLISTPHPKILRAHEAMLSQLEIASMIEELQASITDADALRLRRLIAAKVDGYHVQTDED